MNFVAAVHGMKLHHEGAIPSDGEKSKVIESDDDGLVFKDPKEYEHLSMEERKKLTERMMKKFTKAFSANRNMGVGVGDG